MAGISLVLVFWFEGAGLAPDVRGAAALCRLRCMCVGFDGLQQLRGR
jgi:hypothetical protein